MKKILFAAVLLLGLIPQTSWSYTGDKYYSWGRVSARAGNERDIGILDLFLPLKQGYEALLYTDLRFRDISGSSSEWNAALGYRRIVAIEEKQWVAGFYAALDRLRSPNRNLYSQATIGAELLSENTDFRINGYLPESKSYLLGSALGDHEVSIQGTSIGTRSTVFERREQAMPGFDIELGIKLPIEDQDIWVYAAYYEFQRDGFEEISGPRLRGEWRFADVFGVPGSRLTLDAEASEDDVRDLQYFAGMSLRIPLDPCHPSDSALTYRTPLEERMIEAVVRDIDIVTGSHNVIAGTVSGPAINPLTGSALNGILFAEAGASGTGTLEDPASLEDAFLNAPATNAVIAVLADGGVHVVNSGEDLNDGYTLIGGGGRLEVLTSRGESAFYTIPGAQPTIDASGSVTAMFDMAHNGLISDVTIQDATLLAIRGGSGAGATENATIRNVTIDSPGNSGILFLSLTSGDVLIENVEVTNPGSSAIVLSNGTADVQIKDVTVDGGGDPDAHGIWIAGHTGSMTVENASMTDTQRGIYMQQVNGDVSITNAFISDSATGGVIVVDTDGDVTIRDSEIITVGEEGILVDEIQTGSTVTIEDNTVTDAALNNIQVEIQDANSATAVISGNTSDVAGIDGIRVNAQNTAIISATVQNNTVTDATDDGIELNAAAGTTINASVSGNTVSGEGDADFVVVGAGTCNNCTGP